MKYLRGINKCFTFIGLNVLGIGVELWTGVGAIISKKKLNKNIYSRIIFWKVNNKKKVAYDLTCQIIFNFI